MTSTAPYDAILVVGFGGPERTEDVLPFLENVTRGRNVPRERLLEVAEHYDHFGGVSPINAQIRELIAALRPELDRHGISLPIYWGNRNWHPMLADTLAEMAAARGEKGSGRRARGLQLLLELPPVPGRYRAGPGSVGAGCPGGGQGSRLLQSSRLHRRQCRSSAGGARSNSRGCPAKRAPRVHGS